ncbi:MAG: DinB family protein [Chloroflexi bacterium]|nr:DinB family protein [Chloroflexota bacterium]
MSDEFDRDLSKAREDTSQARDGLLAVLRDLKDEDLDKERRGGWSVRKVLEHAIHSEVLYGRLARHLRELPQPEDEAITVPPPTVASAISALENSRGALETAIDGVDEETFYTLRVVGHEEYSILSLLENVALHDREHAPQIQDIVSSV